jgi:hypothetical protein
MKTYPVRGPRGRFVHLTVDLRRSLCGRKVDGWRVDPDTGPECLTCAEIDLDIHDRGN